MKAKHTPGPWVYFYKHKYDEWHVGIPIEGSTVKIALFPHGIQSGNPEADCQLIAAAPDMLEACKNAISHTAEVNWQEIADAIAKAEGGSK